MQVGGLDHINILTDDLDGTCAFYQAALGLVRAERPHAVAGHKGAWLCDAEGRALVHLQWNDPARDFGAHVPGAPTGAFHHISFRCTGFAEARARLEAGGIAHRVNDGNYGLRQVFVTDPNGISVELNFPLDE